jgi:hypothetical protein
MTKYQQLKADVQIVRNETDARASSGGVTPEAEAELRTVVAKLDVLLAKDYQPN